jgi:hypothetical protein
VSPANVIPLRAGPDAGDYDQELPPDSEPPGGRGGGDDDSGAEDEGPRFGPVVPLGVRTRKGATAFVFLDAAGLETTLSARDMHAAAIIEGLFGGRPAHRFLEQRWPHFIPARDANGKPQRDERGAMVMIPAGWSARECGSDLVAACTRVGAADDAEFRRDGVWSDGAGGLAVHCGNAIYVDGRKREPGLRQGRAIYISAPRRDRPAAEPATAQDCLQLEEDFRLWTYAPAHAAVAPQLLVGMVACGLLSAALTWRPHMAAHGPAGAGKSTLVRLVSFACGMGMPSEDVSEPGIRRLFNARSGLIGLDEKEAAAANTHAVLSLMRGASDGEGAKSVRAAGEGGGVDVFRVAGCFFLAAINPPHLSLADASRITLILLRRGPKDDRRKRQVDQALERARALHPRLLTRLVLHFDRYQANFEHFRAAAIGADATARSADQIASLLAGWQTLTVDDPVTPAVAAELLDPFIAGFTTTSEDAEEEDAGRQALRHMLGSVVQVDRDRVTIAQAIGDGVKAIRDEALRQGQDGEMDRRNDARRWRRRLGAIGLRYHETPCPGILVANGAPIINAAFAGTPWAAMAWQRPLRELPGALETKGSVKFAGNAQARAVLLPLDLFGLDDADDG